MQQRKPRERKLSGAFAAAARETALIAQQLAAKQRASKPTNFGWTSDEQPSFMQPTAASRNKQQLALKHAHRSDVDADLESQPAHQNKLDIVALLKNKKRDVLRERDEDNRGRFCIGAADNQRPRSAPAARHADSDLSIAISLASEVRPEHISHRQSLLEYSANRQQDRKCMVSLVPDANSPAFQHDKARFDKSLEAKLAVARDLGARSRRRTLNCCCS